MPWKLRNLLRPSGDALAAAAVRDYERGHDELDVIRRLTRALAAGLEAFPRDRAYTFLGAAYQDVSMTDEAARAYAEAIALNPSNATALSNLGMLRLEGGDFAAADDLLGRALRANPKSAYAHNNLASSLMRRGRYDEAVPLLVTATALNPSLATAFANLARCYAHVGDDASAETAFAGAERTGYDRMSALQRELREIRDERLVVYFDEASFFGLARALAPDDAELTEALRAAVARPHEHYAAMVARGELAFVRAGEKERALPWIVLGRCLVARGRAVAYDANDPSGVARAVLDAATRGGHLPEGVDAHGALADLELAADGAAGDVLAFVAALLDDLDGARLLVLSLGPEGDLLCPIGRRAWEALAYPYTKGPDGYGRAAVVGAPESERRLDA